MVEHLDTELFEAAKKYYHWWKNKYPMETVYCYAFYSTAMVEYTGITVFTQEGLDKVTNEYMQDDYYKKEGFQSVKKSLRWSPCDSPHHMEDTDIFSAVDDRLAAISREVYKWDVDDPKFEAHIQKMYSAFITALNRFRQEVLNNNHDILLTVWFGDQSDEEINHFVTNCNSPVAAADFQKSWNEAY